MLPSDIDRWSQRHGIPKGDVRQLADVWPFARERHGEHLPQDWEKISVARETFARHGLQRPIWAVPELENRF